MVAPLTTAERTTLSLLLRSIAGDVIAIDTLFAVTGSVAERSSQQNLLRALAGQQGGIDALFSLSPDGSGNLSTAERANMSNLLLALSGDAAALDALNLGTTIGVAITSPLAGATVTAGIAVVITGTISQAGTVAVKLGSTVLGAATIVGLTWSYTWTPQLADIGAQTLNATATAVAGSTGDASGVAVTVAFSPAGMAGLTFWLDGGQSTFSDTGSSVPATAPLGLVARVPQPSPLTGSWASPDAGTSRPFRDAAGFCFEPLPGGSSYSGRNLSPPGAPTMPANDNTIAIHFVSRATETVTLNSWYGFFRAGDVSNGGNRYGLSVNTGKLAYYANNTLRNTTITIPLGAQISVVARWTSTAWDAKVSVNGTTSTFSFSVALPAGTLTTFIAGLIDPGIANNPPHSSISQLFGVGRAVSDAERDLMLTWLDLKPADVAFPVSANFVAIGGDSIGAGQGLGTESSGFVWGMLPALQAVGPQIKILNGSMPADKIAQAQTRYTNTIKPIYSASRAKNILFLQVGTNSLAVGGAAVATYIAAIYALADGARADGFKVILCTLLPRSDAGISGTFNADRATYNADLVANWASHADALCDFAGISGMGADADSTGANYQADHVHPNASGHALMRPVAQAAVVSLL
jgi:lysophospholipase L1-like esterase